MAVARDVVLGCMQTMIMAAEVTSAGAWSELPGQAMSAGATELPFHLAPLQRTAPSARQANEAIDTMTDVEEHSSSSQTDFVTLVSRDGFEFNILRSAACISGAVKKMLDPTSAFVPTEKNSSALRLNRRVFSHTPRRWFCRSQKQPLRI